MNHPVIIFVLILFLFAGIGIFPIASGATAASATTDFITNLYRVHINSHSEAGILAGLGYDPLIKVAGGYLVLVTPEQEDHLGRTGLSHDLIARGVGRKNLAIDTRLNIESITRYPVVFEQNGIRILLVDWDKIDFTDGSPGLAPILTHNLRVFYREPPRFDKSKTKDLMELESLIGLVLQDSCQSYTEQLQAFDGRLAGTASNYASRDWLVDKFIEFGYDSIAIDGFQADIHGHTESCYNVIAYKPGTLYPDDHIIIGAHFDAEEGSPGADDNGSGTAGVLEIARVLKDVETNSTLVFILFDAEESNFGGSLHYANRAVVERERIVFMLNMDMISYLENDTLAELACGENQAFADIWMDMASTLTDIQITGVIDNGFGSDQAIFQLLGFDIVGIMEWIMTPYYHTPQDSTTYLDFGYTKRIVQASLATIYEADGIYIPDTEVAFRFPEGIPLLIMPGIPPLFEISVKTYGDAELVPGSVQLHYSINSSDLVTSAMTDLGNNLYSHTLSALGCYDEIIYYVSAEEVSMGTCYYPNPDTGFHAFVATGLDTVIYDNFDLDLGWISTGDATEGHWVRATPHRLSVNGAPNDQYELGFGSVYLTGGFSGTDHDVDGGTATLISPSFDLTGGESFVQYARWYSNDYFYPYTPTDVMEIYISNNDGLHWTLVESVGPIEEATGGWVLHNFWVSDIVQPTDQVRLRFDASDLEMPSTVEAAVDAFLVTKHSYDPLVITESLPHWNVNAPYWQQLVAVGCAAEFTWTDKYGHLDETDFTLSPDGVLSGTPTSTGTVIFTAVATDNLDNSDEQLYSFTINAALSITTQMLPDGIINSIYSHQLHTTGGTGIKSWTDKNGDLSGTGYDLSADGILSGIAVDTFTVIFTAQVEDAIGALDEKELTLRIKPQYFCGDVNGDEMVNVADAVFIINYVFKGGPAPEPIESGDVNCDLEGNIGDAVYLINYVFNGGPEPCCR
jgi:hypothetical protein